MTAITRSASITPASMSSASPDASETCRIGTLRTSIGSGTVRTPLLIVTTVPARPAAASAMLSSDGDDGPLARPPRRTGRPPPPWVPSNHWRSDPRPASPRSSATATDPTGRSSAVPKSSDTAGDVGGDHQHVGARPPGRAGPPMRSLSMTASTPRTVAVGVADDRDAAAAGGDHHEPAAEQGRDRGRRRGSPAARARRPPAASPARPGPARPGRARSSRRASASGR